MSEKNKHGEGSPVEAQIAEIVREIAELPDRTSPDDWPEAMLVTANELATIVREPLLSAQQRIATLEKGIRSHRDARGDDRCWMDDEEMYRLLPEGFTPPARDTTVELALCRKFVESRRNPATIYVSPERRIEDLEAQVATLEKEQDEAERREHKWMIDFGIQAAKTAAAKAQVADLSAQITARWQPIETAPKNMTEILGDFDGIRRVMWWSDLEGWMLPTGAAKPAQPKHWMPLPDSPLAAQQEPTP